MAGSKTAVALGERDRLERLARMRTAQAQTAARARILLPCDSGETLVSIAERVGLAADSVRPCAARCLEGGVEHAPSDGARSGRPREIDDADRAFVVDLACQRPADLGYAAEPRASDLPWAHAGKVAEAAGHPRLATVATGSARHPGGRPDRAPQDGPLLRAPRPQPRGQDARRSSAPRAAVLPPRRGRRPRPLGGGPGGPRAVLRREAGHPGRARAPPPTRGRQGHGRARLEHRPRPAARQGAARQGHGQARLRARAARDALPPRPADLPAGEATPLAGETHKSSDYVEFLRILDGKYPKGDLIRIVPGDVSAHTSAETRRCLATVPGRLEFVSAPRHGSWPDLVEGLFSRMTRQMLRGIRVSSKDEPEERILRYLGEADAEPVACRWRWSLSDVDPTAEELVVDTLLPDGAGKAS